MCKIPTQSCHLCFVVSLGCRGGHGVGFLPLITMWLFDFYSVANYQELHMRKTTTRMFSSFSSLPRKGDDAHKDVVNDTAAFQFSGSST